MGIEIDLLKNYPKTKRDVSERGLQKTDEDRHIARKFGKEFFDGSRKHGYGGFNYNPKYWQPVIPDFINHFKLTNNCSLLDVGCAKGFMLYDISLIIPEIKLCGIDISSYAIKNCLEEIRPSLQVADAKSLPFDDNSFDVVISINTVHNLELNDCAIALKEIERVSNGKSFITVDAYRNNEEKEAMFSWNLTGKTIMHVDEWKTFFKDIGYSGDYYWFIP